MVATLQSSPQSIQMLSVKPQLAPVKPSAANARVISPQQMAKINEAAKEFEGVYMSEMLKPMFAGIKTDPMFGGGQGEDTFKGLLLQQYGKKIAETRGIGLAKYVRTEMIRIQETQK
jgi:flagellar protein FlgJ